MKVLVLLASFLLYVQCHDIAKVAVVEQHKLNGEDEQLISIDLKKKDGSEEIKMIAEMYIHLVDGIVNINGHPLIHNIVQHVHMNLMIIEFHKGVQIKRKLRPVQFRLYINETTGANGKKVLMIEEEFVQIEDLEVIQIDVQQVIFESSIRKPLTHVVLEESTIHRLPVKNDKHVEFKGDAFYKPKLPHHGYGYEGEHMEHGKYHKCYLYEHYHHHTIKCWFHRLSWRSKLALFSVGFLSLITLVLCCAICVKRRRIRRRALNIAAPIDDSVTVDMDDEKKVKSDESFDFHFAMDNEVVVDDKKVLIEG